MPRKNTRKLYVPESYYHLYNRGANGLDIFREPRDFKCFESLFARFLGRTPKKDERGRPYPWYRDVIQLNSYCLLPNHFHLLVYQTDETAITAFMKSVTSAYVKYYNRKYNQSGRLFESDYKAVLITRNNQLLHITRYIHLNHHDYQTWAHSSYADYLGDARDWLDVERIVELFDSQEQYAEFVADYEGTQRDLSRLKKELEG